MARTDTDSWDLGSSVGATATMVATARALASRQPDPIINDPYAADLIRAVGIDFFTKLVDDDAVLPDDDTGAGIRLMADVMAVRTRFFDDFFADAGEAGIPLQNSVAVTAIRN
jgi:O-methyltransferase involved in polyketide biosynthesis